jgi:L-2,4-diaminobutyric acid acetyltransferase
LVAEQDNQVVGVLIGYRGVKEPETAFCWQIGVLPAWRGQGLARRMLDAWLDLPAICDARWLTATVADDNEASKRLFLGFAQSNGLPCEVSPYFTEDLLPAGHQPEPLYRIGPITAR